MYIRINPQGNQSEEGGRKLRISDTIFFLYCVGRYSYINL
jgi:hypothetical protein